MKYIEPTSGMNMYPIVELTRRNLETLLAKLDDPLSKATLIDGDDKIAVRAVENETHYTDRRPGVVYMPSTGEYS